MQTAVVITYTGTVRRPRGLFGHVQVIYRDVMSFSTEAPARLWIRKKLKKEKSPLFCLPILKKRSHFTAWLLFPDMVKDLLLARLSLFN